MQVDIHVPRFTWPGGPTSMGATLTSLAQTAEAIGVRTMSVMDHWFQMEQMWPADEPMLEGYTTLGFVAAKTEHLRLRLLVGGVSYRRNGGAHDHGQIDRPRTVKVARTGMGSGGTPDCCHRAARGPLTLANP